MTYQVKLQNDWFRTWSRSAWLQLFSFSEEEAREVETWMKSSRYQENSSDHSNIPQPLTPTVWIWKGAFPNQVTSFGFLLLSVFLFLSLTCFPSPSPFLYSCPPLLPLNNFMETSATLYAPDLIRKSVEWNQDPFGWYSGDWKALAPVGTQMFGVWEENGCIFHLLWEALPFFLEAFGNLPL